jgi:hypothetical protein
MAEEVPVERGAGAAFAVMAGYIDELEGLLL